MRPFYSSIALSVIVATALLPQIATADQLSEKELLKKYPNREVFATNLSGIRDFSTEFPLVDLMKQGRPWQTEPRVYVSTVDADGNLTELPEGGAYTTAALGQNMPAGTYTLTWSGTATILKEQLNAGQITKDEANRIEFELADSKGKILVHVETMDPNDPIRDIHLYLPGGETANSWFNPEFLDYIEPFGVLRFMDWQETNNSDQVNWSKRPRPEQQTWKLEGSTGAPVEVMCDLANRMHSDPWFCMPHLANDEYVREFAKLVKQELDPNRKIYIELSNEVWNFSFQQTKHFADIGENELGVKVGNSPTRAAYALRSREIFKIWEDVFGGRDRFVRVCASQSANPRISEITLKYENSGEHFDALAVAPYFGFNKELSGKFKANNESSVDDIFAAALTVINEKTAENISDQKALADQYGLRLIAYEAGQHLLDRTGRGSRELTPLAQKYLEANRDQRMADLYTRYFEVWFNNGGDLLGMFSSIHKPASSGSWGMSEYLGQPLDEAPKYRATLEAIKNPNLRARK